MKWTTGNVFGEKKKVGENLSRITHELMVMEKERQRDVSGRGKKNCLPPIHHKSVMVLRVGERKKREKRTQEIVMSPKWTKDNKGTESCACVCA